MWGRHDRLANLESAEALDTGGVEEAQRVCPCGLVFRTAAPHPERTLAHLEPTLAHLAFEHRESHLRHQAGKARVLRAGV